MRITMKNNGNASATTLAASSEYFEGCGQEGPIKCIFLSEFHPVAGPKISCQVPSGYVSKDIFDAVNVYIIPKCQLQRCILTVNTLGYKIVGFPVRIDNQRYARNAYYFNLCFVCDDWARTVQYEPLVKKLAEYLIIMEEESQFLSKESNKNDRIQLFLNKILQDLNENGMSTVVEGKTTIYLKILRHKTDPVQVDDHMVPIVRPEFRDLSKDSWDLTTQQVLPFIDGYKHIARIAAESYVENALVKACIQNLVYYEVVQLIPLLKYSNIYMCTSALQRLVKESDLAQLCRQYVAVKHTPDERPSLHKILKIYSSMTHGVTLKDICNRTNPRDSNIDERKLIVFGLQNNLIRCINKYPICVKEPIGRQKFYTGLQSMDEISCKIGIPPSKIQEDLDTDPCLSVFWK